MEKQKVILVILDGWGHGPDPARSAIAQANTPYVDSLYDAYPHAELVTFGEEVGLPEGQMGNSEVGHLNIGAGRIVYQELARINKAIRDGEFQKNETLLKALQEAKERGSAVHLMGLLSNGGVHSHINHLQALCDTATDQGLEQVYIHAFLDGRDCDPKSGAGFLQDLEDHIDGQPVRLASVIGRYYAMDRDNRWERIKLAYDLIVKGAGVASRDAVADVKSRYERGETDEFIKPIVCVDEQGDPIATLSEGDLLICFNFRTDRPREISEVLTQNDKPDHGMYKIPVDYVTMTRYDESFRGVQVLFTKDNLENTLGEILAKAERTQVRIAETEKYPHVTFFFSGGREDEFPHERRILIPSPKVATYDLQPEMSAPQITAAITADIRAHQPDFICLNYANTDMVGHTGDFEAAKIAAATVDDCLRELMEVALNHSYVAIVIADHGNSDYMINEDGSPNTAHTMNPVPVFYLSKDQRNTKLKNGKLGDIAPTVLTLMGIPIPEEMNGEILINR